MPSFSRRYFLKGSLSASAAAMTGWASHKTGPFAKILSGQHDENDRLHLVDSFSFAVIPDIHVDYKCSGEHLSEMSHWIVRNARALNIRFVVQLGDVGDRRGSGNLLEMLKIARTGLEPINLAGIPLSVCIGNHDYDIVSSVRSNRYWNMPETFGLPMYEFKPWFGGTFEREYSHPGQDPGGTANHYITLESSGRQFLLLNLETGPREKVMSWANQLVLEKYPRHEVLLFTHSYLHTSGERVRPTTRYNPKNYTGFSTVPGPDYTNDGEDLWQKYLRFWPNLRSVHSGHAINEPTQAWKTSAGYAGNTVHEFFYNWQNWGYDPDRGQIVYGQGSPFQATTVRLFQVYILDDRVEITNSLPPAGVNGEKSNPVQYAWYG